MRARIAKVVSVLESLRFDYLHASIGLPLPSYCQLVALARLRPSSLPLDPLPPTLTPAGSNSSDATINPVRVGPLPLWTIYQTRAFGQVFLDRMKVAAREQGLSLDAYAVTAAAAAAAAKATGGPEATCLQPWHHEAVAAFNGGRSVPDIVVAWKVPVPAPPVTVRLRLLLGGKWGEIDRNGLPPH
jgi:hypothetical protein